jgi:hypothetical protein
MLEGPGVPRGDAACSPTQRVLQRHFGGAISGEVSGEFAERGSQESGWGNIRLTSDDLTNHYKALRRPGKRVGEERVGEERAAAERPAPLLGHRYFYDSDYAVHRRAGFMVSLRLHSSRTVSCACVNSEGKTCEHAGDGVTNIYNLFGDGLVSKTDNKQQLFPLFNWQRLPGITAEIDPQLLQICKNNGPDKRMVSGLRVLIDPALHEIYTNAIRVLPKY